jgi:hypothetical protein
LAFFLERVSPAPRRDAALRAHAPSPSKLNPRANTKNAKKTQGSETTSYTATWALGLLATHPSTQSALARELAGAGLAPSTDSSAAAAATPPRAFDWADLNKLPYLNAVIKETLRLYSPASLGSSREAVRDVEVCFMRARV